jgi:hypothetical protein
MKMAIETPLDKICLENANFSVRFFRFFWLVVLEKRWRSVLKKSVGGLIVSLIC